MHNLIIQAVQIICLVASARDQTQNLVVQKASAHTVGAICTNSIHLRSVQNVWKSHVGRQLSSLATRKTICCLGLNV